MFESYISIHGVTGSPTKDLFLIRFFIYFKVYFNQAFLTSTGNLMNNTKFLGYGMKCETSDPDYTKVVNAFFILFTTALKNYENYPPYSLLIVLLLSIHFAFVQYDHVFSI